MNKFLLPPTPNWYLNNTFSCTSDDTIVYASRADIVVILPAGQDEIAEVRIFSKKHKNRIISVNTNPNWSGGDKFIVTTGEDNLACVWDVDGNLVHQNKDHQSRHEDKILSAAFTNFCNVVSVSERGYLISWRLRKIEILYAKSIFDKGTKLTCMSVCPHSEKLVALGTTKGEIIIFDLKKRKQLLKFKNESESIISLSWCPVPGNIFPKCDLEKIPVSQPSTVDSKQETHDRIITRTCSLDNLISNGCQEISYQRSKSLDNIQYGLVDSEQDCQIDNENEPNVEYLLASSNYGGKTISIWRAGTNGLLQLELNLPLITKKKFKDKKDLLKTPWITTCWISPCVLLSSSSQAQLLRWNLTNNSNRCQIIHSYHYGHLFNIVTARNAALEENVPRVWTCGKERQLLAMLPYKNAEISVRYPTIAGFIQTIAASVVSPTMIALGLNEGHCRFWDLSQSSKQKISMTSFDKMYGKVNALAWNPKNESQIAFGTTDGGVGLINLLNLKNHPVMCVQNTCTVIISVEWGPDGFNKDKEMLYVLLDRHLLVYDVQKTGDKPKTVDISNVSAFAWKPDFTLCAVGTKAGHVAIYNAMWNLLYKFCVQNRIIRCLTWHPDVTVNNKNYSYWLTSCSNELIVYDCSLIGNTQDDSLSKQVVNTFQDKKRTQVNKAYWNPHCHGVLAIISNSNVLTIWNAVDNTILNTIVRSGLVCDVLWSPINDDYIIISDRDVALEIVKISEHPSQPEFCRSDKDSKLKEENACASVNKDFEATRKQRYKYVLASLADSQNFCEYSEALDDCKRLFEVIWKKKEVEKKPLDILKLFGTIDDLKDLFDVENNSHSMRRAQHSKELVCLWQGNFADCITQAIANKSLTPWHVSISPMVSYQCWRNTIDAYISQLLDESSCSAYELCCFYLTLHRVDDAINILCEHHKYREAIALAKYRLDPADPRINKVTESYALFCQSNGNYEQAAKCFIVLGRFQDAIMVLLKRTPLQEDTLKLCEMLAEHCGDEKMLQTVRFRRENFEVEESDVGNADIPLPSRLQLELGKYKSACENLDEKND